MLVHKILFECVILSICAGVFCAGVAETTLGEEEGRKKRFIKWSAATLIFIILSILFEIGVEAIDTYINTTVDADNVMIASLYIFLNMIKRMKPIFLAFFAFIWIYHWERNVKIFAAILTGLVIQIIINYFIPVAQIPFLGEDDGWGTRDIPPVGISIVISVVLFSAFFVIYWYAFSKKMRKFLEVSQKYIQKFLKIPIWSSIFFVVLISTLSTYGYVAESVDIYSVQTYIVVFLFLILTYILIYWCIFRGISLSEIKMRNHADLDVARNIQMSVLPCEFPAYPDRDEFSVYATMDAAKEVGGDFYDFFLIDENHLAVVIADVSGKGVPAALFMMTARTLLKNLFMAGKEPSEVMTEANEALCENNEEEMFVTVFAGILEIDTGKFVYANAGHNPPFLARGENPYEILKVRPGFVLGGMEGIRYRQQELSLEAGDTLYLYTDGVTEALNPEDELYSEKRLKTLLNSDALKDAAIEEILHSVRKDIDLFADGAQQADDITMLILRILK